MAHGQIFSLIVFVYYEEVFLKVFVNGRDLQEIVLINCYFLSACHRPSASRFLFIFPYYSSVFVSFCV